MEVDYSNLPKHIAIIMDGNRRWAKENGLTTKEGHKKGAKN
jgi:undecaprenyl diphosphate synthase